MTIYWANIQILSECTELGKKGLESLQDLKLMVTTLHKNTQIYNQEQCDHRFYKPYTR